MPVWKNLERKTAKLTGGERAHFQPLDVEHEHLAIECKHREKLAVWTWFKKLEKKAKGKMPVLVLKEKGKHGELAVVRLENLLSLLKAGDEHGI
ncbi:MAG: hypothetical protein QME41_03845 [Actinomycetota bacterium]|nr:hypothetical protein [Actinomycetota bacterium]